MAKITNYEDDGNIFEFPYNPQEYSSSINQKSETTQLDYRFIHFSITSKNIKPREININGHFSGENKYKYFNQLVRRVTDGKLKRFYLDNDRFIIIFSGNVETTKANNRPNMVDYVGVLKSPIGMYQGTTLREAEYDGSWDSEPENEGDFYTIIEEIKIHTTGGSSGDNIEIKDNEDNGLNLSLTKDISSGTIITIRALSVEKLGSGILTTRIYEGRYPDGENIPTSRVSGTDTKQLILDAGDSISNFNISGNLGFSKIEFKFRDGYVE